MKIQSTTTGLDFNSYYFGRQQQPKQQQPKQQQQKKNFTEFLIEAMKKN